MKTQNSINSKPSTLNLKLTRTRIRGEYCEGYLSIDGTRICDTLENSNAQIPAGEYPITLVKCKQYSRKMPLLVNHEPLTLNAEGVASESRERSGNLEPCCGRCLKLRFVNMNTTLPCYCPMIKPGNGVHNRLDGSILVGQYNCLGCLFHPKTTFDPLYERIRKSVSRGNQVILTIKDVPSTLSPHPSTKIFV